MTDIPAQPGSLLPPGQDPPVPADLVDGLNPEQAAAVQALLGPLVVVAGPGSGKTRVLTHRVAALVRTRLAFPSQVLAVTFTNKAAGEMRERLELLLGPEETERMWVTTFHAMCARILRMEHEAAGLPRSYTILDSGDVRTVLRGVLEELNLQAEAQEIRAYASAISRIKNGASLRPDRTLAAVLDGYTRALVRIAAVDFDDLLLRAALLLESDAEVRERWQSRFRFVLVDEFQDTNPVQYRLVQLLGGTHRNVCVVGDADQAIYGFRSATPEALHRFADDWPGGRVVILEQNYRSSGAIIEVCRSIIDVQASPLRPRLFTANDAGTPVRLVVCDDDRDEATFAAQELSRRAVQHSAAILVRTNAQTRPFEEALLLARVPYQVVGALRFYERAEVKDALSYLRLAANPFDQVALTRAAAAPRRGLGPKALAELAATAQALDGDDRGDLLRAMRVMAESGSGRSRATWKQFADQMDAVIAAAHADGPAGALMHVVDSGLRDHVRATGGENAADRVEDLAVLVSAAKSFVLARDVVDPEARIPEHLSGWEQTEDFLANVALVSAADEEGVDPERGLPVQVMTAHASKGKEFDHVVVAGVEEGLFPHARGQEEAPEDEERRLLFVACSRARQVLLITRATRRMVFGKVSENPPSRFLADLPDTVVTEVRRGAARSGGGWGWADRPGANGRGSGIRQNAGRPPGTRMAGSTMPPRPARKIATGPRLDPVHAVEGAKVRHPVFGAGVIEDVFGETGDLSVSVAFGDQVRVLKLALAPMELDA